MDFRQHAKHLAWQLYKIGCNTIVIAKLFLVLNQLLEESPRTGLLELDSLPTAHGCLFLCTRLWNILYPLGPKFSSHPVLSTLAFSAWSSLLPVRSVLEEQGKPGQQTEFILRVSSDQLVVTIQSATLSVPTLKRSSARIYWRYLLSTGERGEVARLCWGWCPGPLQAQGPGSLLFLSSTKSKHKITW